ncbi:MAG: UDP-3-O-(3-hydroxymyristoyl)glucosamine N-acyltransferase [Deltaproteobacteria bacterium]|nr:UDP-3-O-(3-hydroxymyristoyl)glucosamine N-acyltransferase [Deltaproteobacteria bacterium]
MELKLFQVAELLGGVCHGNGEAIIRSVSGIDEALPGDITFLANKKYQKSLHKTRATAVLVVQKYDIEINQVVVPDAYVAFGTLLGVFYPQEEQFCGISEKAFIEEGASIASGATIFPFACVRRGARIGGGAIIYPGAYIGTNSGVGEESIIHANVVIAHDCQVGRNVIIHAGSVIGADGFGFANPGGTNYKIPQVGLVQIDDNCEIGANVTIDRGTMGKTHLQENVKIDNLVQIAHNVVIGKNSVIVAQTGIAGSTKIGESNIIGGQSAIAGHLKIGNRVMLAARSGVHGDVQEGSVVAGTPHREYQRWLRIEAVISRLPEMREKVIQLQERIEQLETIITTKEGVKNGHPSNGDNLP